MINKHPADEEVQQYAIDKAGCNTATTGHIEQCEECKARVETYRLLITIIKEQPESVFDYNLAETVLAQLPSPQSKTSPNNLFIYLLVSAVILLTGALCYSFRDYLATLFSGIAPLLVSLVATIAISVSAGLCIDMYRKYQKKIQQLDFYSN